MPAARASKSSRGEVWGAVVMVLFVLFFASRCMGGSDPSSAPTASVSEGSSPVVPSPSESDSSSEVAPSEEPSDSGGPSESKSPSQESDPSPSVATGPAGADGRGAGIGAGAAYQVVSVVDGDTIKVRIDGEKTTIRIIGLDTPETKKPNEPVQCFGKEASSNMQRLVQSKTVQLAADPTQDDRDKYGRLLRHVFVNGSTNVALAQIQGGFGREYTYDTAYAYQSQYRAAEATAQAAKRGTWGAPCSGFHKADAAAATAPTPTQAAPAPPANPTAAAPLAPNSGTDCTIKGNINSKGEKIAHAPGSRSYAKTRITASKGERMFCSISEALAAGWRMAAD